MKKVHPVNVYMCVHTDIDIYIYLYLYTHTHTKSVTMLNTHPLNHCTPICCFTNAMHTLLEWRFCWGWHRREPVAPHWKSRERNEKWESPLPLHSIIHAWFNKSLPLYSCLVHQQAPPSVFMPGSSTSPSLCIYAWFIKKPLPLYSRLVHQQAPPSVFMPGSSTSPSLCIALFIWFINNWWTPH